MCSACQSASQRSPLPIWRGCVKTSKPPPRASPTSVMPAPSASRTAWAVGAETAITTGAPASTLFCTISTETRLVSTTAPAPSRRRRHRAPAPRLAYREHCAARHPRGRHGSFPQGDRTRRRGPPGSDRAAVPPVRQRCRCGFDVGGGQHGLRAVTDGSGRSASSRLSMPHRPQPTGPATKRRRRVRAPDRPLLSHIRSSMPFDAPQPPGSRSRPGGRRSARSG